MRGSPCLKCDKETPEKRDLGCHDRCPAYKEYKDRIQQYKDNWRDKYDHCGHVSDTILRFKRNRNSRKDFY